MNRRGILKALVATGAAVLGGVWSTAKARAQTTKHIRLYVEMDVDPANEKPMLDLFHNQFVPEAVKHPGYIRVKMLKLRTVIQGAVPMQYKYRFELEYENEEQRQLWIASAGHKRVWPPIERLITTKDYPVTLYDEA